MLEKFCSNIFWSELCNRIHNEVYSRLLFSFNIILKSENNKNSDRFHNLKSIQNVKLNLNDQLIFLNTISLIDFLFEEHFKLNKINNNNNNNCEKVLCSICIARPLHLFPQLLTQHIDFIRRSEQGRKRNYDIQITFYSFKQLHFFSWIFIFFCMWFFSFLFLL